MQSNIHSSGKTNNTNGRGARCIIKSSTGDTECQRGWGGSHNRRLEKEAGQGVTVLFSIVDPCVKVGLLQRVKLTISHLESMMGIDMMSLMIASDHIVGIAMIGRCFENVASAPKIHITKLQMFSRL